MGARVGSSVVAFGLAVLAAFTAAAQTRPLTAADKAHITAVENGLLPAVIIKGRPAQSASLIERMRQTKVPGVSIAFFDHGHIVWAKGYGLADVVSGRPVTPETMFEAGSISKPMAALVALRMVEEGRLSLDQDVNERLKAWHVPANAFTAKEKVTLRRLLSHGAGLTVHGFPGYEQGHPLPSLAQILNGEAPADTPAVVVEAVPGSRWSYSGGGYVAAQLLMTETSGEPFPDLAREEVFSRIGMTHSTYAQPLTRALWDKAATGYLASGAAVPGNWHVYPEMAPAGLWTTPSDLARAAIAVQKAQAGGSHRLLSRKTAREMLTHQIGAWGLGFELANDGGDLRFGHGGDDVGFKADLEAYTTGSGQGVAILTNGDGGNTLIPEILRAVAKSYGWKAYRPEERAVVNVDPGVLARYIGRYQIPGLTTVAVSAKGEDLFITVPLLGPEPQPVLAQSPNQFFSLSNGVLLEFVGGPDAAPAKIVITGSYGRFEATRTP